MNAEVFDGKELEPKEMIYGTCSVCGERILLGMKEDEETWGDAVTKQGWVAKPDSREAGGYTLICPKCKVDLTKPQPNCEGLANLAAKAMSLYLKSHGDNLVSIVTYDAADWFISGFKHAIALRDQIDVILNEEAKEEVKGEDSDTATAS